MCPNIRENCSYNKVNFEINSALRTNQVCLTKVQWLPVNSILALPKICRCSVSVIILQNIYNSTNLVHNDISDAPKNMDVFIGKSRVLWHPLTLHTMPQLLNRVPNKLISFKFKY